MPKAHYRRSARSRKRAKAGFPFLYLALAILLTSILFIWIITSVLSSGLKREYRVVGKPTVSVSFINRVLEYYHSPASGMGQSLYDYGVEYKIDPAYALAFFMQESTFGTKGVATVTHSLGNIRATGNYHQFKGYRYYNTWKEGFLDWYKLIANLYVAKWGLYTVDQIIPVYAPGSDQNDERAYIRSVKIAVDTWHSGIIEV